MQTNSANSDVYFDLQDVIRTVKINHWSDTGCRYARLGKDILKIDRLKITVLRFTALFEVYGVAENIQEKVCSGLIK